MPETNVYLVFEWHGAQGEEKRIHGIFSSYPKAKAYELWFMRGVPKGIFRTLNINKFRVNERLAAMQTPSDGQ